MRIIKIGKRQFAFDLNWTDSFGEDAKDAVIAAVGESVPSLYTVVEGIDGDGVLGYGPAGDVKGPVYSYAQALAKRDADGVYAAPVGSDRIWFVAIVKGVVVAASDRTMEAYEAEDEIRDILRTTNIPFFAADGCLSQLADLLETRGREIIPFDVGTIVARMKVKPLKATVTESNPVVGGLLLCGVLAALSYGAWAMFLRKSDVGIDPAVVAEEARAAYAAASSMELAKVPSNAAWAVEGYRVASLSYPWIVSGWAFDGATCVPATCTGVYTLDTKLPGYSISAIYARFGREKVTVLPDRKSLNVVVSLADQPSEPATDAEIFSPLKGPIDVMDVLGALPTKFSEVSIDGELTVESMGQMLSAPADAPPLYRERFATKYAAALDMVMLRNLTSYMADAGFSASTLSYSRGSGVVPASWRIEWVRIHGGD